MAAPIAFRSSTFAKSATSSANKKELPGNMLSWPNSTSRFLAAQTLVNKSVSNLSASPNLNATIQTFFDDLNVYSFDPNVPLTACGYAIESGDQKAHSAHPTTLEQILNNVWSDDAPNAQLAQKLKGLNQPSITLVKNLATFFLIVQHFMSQNAKNHKLYFHTINHGLDVAIASQLFFLNAINTDKVFVDFKIVTPWRVFLFCCGLFHDSIFRRERGNDEYSSVKLFVEVYQALIGRTPSQNFQDLVKAVIIGGTLPIIIPNKPVHELYSYCDGLEKQNLGELKLALEAIAFADIHMTCFPAILNQHAVGEIPGLKELAQKAQEYFPLTGSQTVEQSAASSSLPSSDKLLSILKLGHNVRVIIEGFSSSPNFIKRFLAKLLTSKDLVQSMTPSHADFGELKLILNNHELLKAENAIQKAFEKLGLHAQVLNNEQLVQIIYEAVFEELKGEILFLNNAKDTENPKYIQVAFEPHSWKDLATLYYFLCVQEKRDTPHLSEIIQILIEAARIHLSQADLSVVVNSFILPHGAKKA